jgi:hypothetical protein
LEWVQKNGVVPLKADKSGDAPDVDALLVELGNIGKGIPFYAIFPGDGRSPILFDGFLTQNQVIEKLKEAGPSKPRAEATAKRPDPDGSQPQALRLGAVDAGR